MAGAKRQRRTQAERREEAEQRIILAAIGLLAERGYHAFTLADVGEASGYSRGLPAHYFGRKDELLAEVVRYIIGTYTRALAELKSESPGFPRLADVIREYAQHSRTEEGRALVIVLTEAIVEPTLKPVITDVTRGGVIMLEGEIRAGIRAGNIRRNVSVQAVARGIYAFLRGQMAFSAFDRSYEVSSTVEEFIAMLQAYLRPQS